MSFEQWISDGTVLSKVMRTISFNSVEEEIGGNYGSSEDIARSRVRIKRIKLKAFHFFDADPKPHLPDPSQWCI